MDELKTAGKAAEFLKFTIQVNVGPYAGEAADLAYHFALAALTKGHKVPRVFFYHDGVYHALGLAAPPLDEPDRVMRWSRLAETYNVDLVICSAAAQRRGVWVPETQVALAPRFRIAGLALLVEAILETDRLLVFG
ncbi:sulfurtransferase complex subunit TusD [Methylothermus subterraneus]